MKQILKKLGIYIAIICVAIPASGYDFVNNGIRYSILSTIQKTVTVEGGDFCEIPSIVEYQGVQYTVIEIGKNAFYNTSLYSISLPATLVRISDSAFEDVKLSIREVTIPDGVEKIGKGAFRDSNIQKLVIGKSVIEIGESAFSGCSSLKQLVLKPNYAPSYDSDKTLGQALEIIVPVRKLYENSSLGRALIGEMIEPISFETDRFTYSGAIPKISYTKNISGLVAAEVNFDAVTAGDHNASISFYSGLFGGGIFSYEYPIEICKAPLTINIGDKTREYGLPNPNLDDYSVTGFVNGESENVLSNPIMPHTSATITSNVGEYPITYSGTARNYELIVTDGRLTITKAPLIVQVEDAERQYGENNPQFHFQFLNLRNNDTPELITPFNFQTATKLSDVGSYPIKCSEGSLINYEVTEYRDGILTITKAPLSLAANAAERVYYEDNPKFTFLLSGLRNSDDASCITTPPIFNCTADISSDCGEYDIIPSNADAKI